MFLELVVDVNVLFSALLANRLTRSLVFDPRVKLYAPEYLLSELIKHLETNAEIKGKLEQTGEETHAVLHEILRAVEVIPIADYAQFIKKALEITPDEYDAPYFALALHLEIPVWSNDKQLKNQNAVEVYNTKEVLQLLSEKLS